MCYRVNVFNPLYQTVYLGILFYFQNIMKIQIFFLFVLRNSESLGQPRPRSTDLTSPDLNKENLPVPAVPKHSFFSGSVTSC